MCKNLVVYTDVSYDDEWMGIGYTIFKMNDNFERELLELGNRVIDHTKLDRHYTSHKGEFRALISGVRAATDYGADTILCCVDDKELNRKVTENTHIADDGYFQHALRSFLGRFDDWRVTAVHRDDNELAHKQARVARDAGHYADGGIS